MIERLISFASPGDGFYGAVALAPAGSDGTAAAVGYVAGPDGELRFDDASTTRGEGILRVTGSGDDELILGLAAQTSPLAFETGEGRAVTVQAIGASAELTGPTATDFNGGFEATGVSWALEGEEDQASLRAAWAALADGSLLVLFGLRAPDEDDHGGETVGTARVSKDGAVLSYAEPLLSTEYDAAGRQTRATLELWGDEEAGLPTRGAGRRELGGAARAEQGRLEAARFGWRVDGTPGFGAYEIFS